MDDYMTGMFFRPGLWRRRSSCKHRGMLPKSCFTAIPHRKREREKDRLGPGLIAFAGLCILSQDGALRKFQGLERLESTAGDNLVRPISRRLDAKWAVNVLVIFDHSIYTSAFTRSHWTWWHQLTLHQTWRLQTHKMNPLTSPHTLPEYIQACWTRIVCCLLQ